MRKIIATIASAIAIVALAQATEPVKAYDPGYTPIVTVDVQDGKPVYSPLEQILIDSATQAYESHSLEVPDVAIRFDCDLDTDHGGMYYRETSTICIQRMDVATLVHELAHAWDTENLSDTERKAYIDHMGERYTNWLDHSESYLSRAGESFARQMEMHLLPDVRTDSYDADAVRIAIGQ